MADSSSDSDNDSEVSLSSGPFISPLRIRRSVTDVCYAGFFYIFLIFWFIVIILAFYIGDLQNLQPPVDNEGRRCGIDIEVKNRPFLLFFDISKYSNGSYSTTLTCLPECPRNAFLYKKDVTQDIKNIIPKIICKQGVDVKTINSWDVLDKYVKEAKCAELYLESKPLNKRCVPTRIPDEIENRISHKNVMQLVNFISEKMATENLLYYLYSEGFAIAKNMFIGFTLLAGALSIIYIVTLRWFTKPLFYLSTCALFVIMLFVICQAAMVYSSDKNRISSLMLLITFPLLLVLYVIVFIIRWSKIKFACKLIEELSKVAALPSSLLLLPILEFFLYVLLIVLQSAVTLRLSTVTEDIFKVKISDDGCNCPSSLHYDDGALCNPEIFMRECTTNVTTTCFESGCRYSEYTVPTYVKFMYFISGYSYWLILLVIVFKRTILAGVFAEWYWTSDKTLYPKFTLFKMMGITAWYHCGPLVRGSVLVPLEIVGDCLTRYTFNAIALYGKSFARSSSAASELLIRNDNFLTFDKFTGLILHVGIASITGLTTTVCWLSCASFFEEDVTANVGTIGISIFLVIVGISSLVFATLVMSVLKNAIDTIYICFLEDSKRNDGSEEKPYFASLPLRELLQN